MWVLDFENKSTFCVITSLNDVITSKILHRCKALVQPFHTRYYWIWFSLNINLTYILNNDLVTWSLSNLVLTLMTFDVESHNRAIFFSILGHGCYNHDT